MIVRITKGRNFEGAVAYDLKKGRGTIIGGNLAGRNVRSLSAEAHQFRKLRPTLDRYVAHIMLSAAPEDPPMDEKTWCAIADRVMHDLGFSDCARVYVRHSDTENDHIHIVALRIRNDGKTVPETNDRIKAIRSLASIEADFGLRRVNRLKAGYPSAEKAKGPMRRSATQSIQKANSNITKEEKMTEVNITNSESEPEPTVPEIPGKVDASRGLGRQRKADDPSLITAMVGDNPSERKRREIKRVIRSPDYDRMVRHLLEPDVTHIFHHPRGSVIYLASPERIADDGDLLTAHHMNHGKAARAMVALACARGWTSIVFNGPTDFIVAAMAEAVAQGLPVHPRDAMQKAILEQIMAGSGGGMGAIAIPMAFQPPVPVASRPQAPPASGPQPGPQSPLPPDVPPVELKTNLASQVEQRRQHSRPEKRSTTGPKNS